MGTRVASEERPSWRTFAMILVVATVVRGVALWAASDALPLKDELSYLQRSEALLQGHGFLGSYQSWVRHPFGSAFYELPQYPGAYQPPGYTFFMAAVLSLGGGVLGVKLAQIGLGVLSVALVYVLGRRFLAPKTAMLAAAATALYPNLVAFTHLLWSETLFIALLLGGLTLLAHHRRLPSTPAAISAGVLFGAAALTRSTLALFLPVLLLWFVVCARREWRHALLLATCTLLAAAAVVLPWSLRNLRLLETFVLIDNNGPFNFWRGNQPETFQQRGDSAQLCYQAPFDSIPLAPVGNLSGRLLVQRLQDETGRQAASDAEVTAFAFSSAIAFIQNNPRAFLQRAGPKLLDLWNPTSFLLRHLHPTIRGYGEVAPGWSAFLRWSAVLAYLLVVVAALGGMLAQWRNPLLWLTLLWIGFQSAICVLAFGLTRFRLPLMPFLILFAAQGVWCLIETFPHRKPPLTAPVPEG